MFMKCRVQSSHSPCGLLPHSDRDLFPPRGLWDLLLRWVRFAPSLGKKRYRALQLLAPLGHPWRTPPPKSSPGPTKTMPSPSPSRPLSESPKTASHPSPWSGRTYILATAAFWRWLALPAARSSCPPQCAWGPTATPRRKASPWFGLTPSPLHPLENPGGSGGTFASFASHEPEWPTPPPNPTGPWPWTAGPPCTSPAPKGARGWSGPRQPPSADSASSPAPPKSLPPPTPSFSISVPGAWVELVAQPGYCWAPLCSWDEPDQRREGRCHLEVPGFSSIPRSANEAVPLSGTQKVVEPVHAWASRKVSCLQLSTNVLLPRSWSTKTTWFNLRSSSMLMLTPGGIAAGSGWKSRFRLSIWMRTATILVSSKVTSQKSSGSSSTEFCTSPDGRSGHGMAGASRCLLPSPRSKGQRIGQPRAVVKWLTGGVPNVDLRGWFIFPSPSCRRRFIFPGDLLLCRFMFPDRGTSPNRGVLGYGRFIFPDHLRNPNLVVLMCGWFIFPSRSWLSRGLGPLVHSKGCQTDIPDQTRSPILRLPAGDNAHQPTHRCNLHRCLLADNPAAIWFSRSLQRKHLRTFLDHARHGVEPKPLGPCRHRLSEVVSHQLATRQMPDLPFPFSHSFTQYVGSKTQMPCAPRPRRTLHDRQGRRVVPVDYPLSLLGAPASSLGDVQDGTEGVSHDHRLDVAHQLCLCRAEGTKWLATRSPLDEGTTVESQDSLVALLSAVIFLRGL